MIAWLIIIIIIIIIEIKYALKFSQFDNVFGKRNSFHAENMTVRIIIINYNAVLQNKDEIMK